MHGKIKQLNHGHWNNAPEYQGCSIREVEVDDVENWVEITLKSMPDVLLAYDCWFDCHGNLVSPHGHLAPSHFGDLGKTFHVKVGCGYSIKEESGWLWRSA